MENRMRKHKSKASEKNCLCDNCNLRFVCFTQERIFSEALYQGLFEALMAQGRSKEEALQEVTSELKSRLPYSQIVGKEWYGGSAGDTDGVSVPAAGGSLVTIGSPYLDDNDYKVNITYTMVGGEEISWKANANEFLL
jgi:hypothetical protein